MRIEETLPSDRESVVAIWGRAGLSRPWNDLNEDFDTALANQQQTILVAKEGSDIAGAVMVADDGRSGWIYLLGVDPNWERQGIGESLMEAAERWLAKREQYNVFLLVRNENEKVVPFYEHLGYEERPVRVFRKGLPETKTL
jgi:ribosomal protein S18 acetylase RimI-like enzyme